MHCALVYTSNRNGNLCNEYEEVLMLKRFRRKDDAPVNNDDAVRAAINKKLAARGGVDQESAEFTSADEVDNGDGFQVAVFDRATFDENMDYLTHLLEKKRSGKAFTASGREEALFKKGHS